LYLNIYI